MSDDREEVKSAFYWRETLHLSSAYSGRRSADEIAALRRRVADLRAAGLKQSEVAETLGISRRYAQELEFPPQQKTPLPAPGGDSRISKPLRRNTTENE